MLNRLARASATAVMLVFRHLAVLAVLKTAGPATASLARTLRGLLVYESVPTDRRETAANGEWRTSAPPLSWNGGPKTVCLRPWCP